VGLFASSSQTIQSQELNIMKNFVQPGSVITATAPYALASGDGALVGITFGIASGAAAISTPVELQLEGVYDITALGTDVVAAPAMVAAYWDNTNKRITTTVGANTKVGVIILPKANGDTTARVRLNGAF
jgi:predicted RecA/RadA family phage recombinase